MEECRLLEEKSRRGVRVSAGTQKILIQGSLPGTHPRPRGRGSAGSCVFLEVTRSEAYLR